MFGVCALEPVVVECRECVRSAIVLDDSMLLLFERDAARAK